MKAEIHVTDELNIKGMICTRCLKVLNTELKSSGSEVIAIQLGKITIRYNPKRITNIMIRNIIHDNGFEIITDQNSIQAEEIKRLIINYIWDSNLELNLSNFLIGKTSKNYDQLSKTFSRFFGKTIERYSMQLKIERTKEYIQGGDLNFSEIAYALGYQNTSSLSRQFKMETGITMKEFKKQHLIQRIPIDKI